MTDGIRPDEVGSPHAPVDPATGAPVQPASVPPPPPAAPPPAMSAPPPASPAAPEKRGGGKGAIIILGAIAVFIGVVLFLVRNNVEADDLAVGDCFNVPSGTSIQTVEKFPCTESHTAEVIFVGEYDGDTYPISLSLNSYMETNCEPAFQAYVGRAIDSEPPLEIGAFYPSRDGWNDGDKTITCYVAQPDDAPMTQSVKASTP